MPKQVKDIASGETFYTSERIGDDTNGMEVRETFYIRDPDRQCRHPHNVAVAQIGTIQGDPESMEPPRYRRVSKEPCRDPGEMDGRTSAYTLSERTAVWEQSI